MRICIEICIACGIHIIMHNKWLPNRHKRYIEMSIFMYIEVINWRPKNSKVMMYLLTGQQH